MTKRFATGLLLTIFLSTQFAVGVPVYNCRHTGLASLQCCCAQKQKADLVETPVKSCCRKHAAKQTKSPDGLGQKKCSTDCCYISPLFGEVFDVALEGPTPTLAPQPTSVTELLPLTTPVRSWSSLTGLSPPRPPLYLQLCRLLA